MDKAFSHNFAMQKCFKHGVTVYPILSGSRFKIQRNVNGKLFTYPKEITTKQVDNAMKQTYINLASKL